MSQPILKNSCHMNIIYSSNSKNLAVNVGGEGFSLK